MVHLFLASIPIDVAGFKHHKPQWGEGGASGAKITNHDRHQSRHQFRNSKLKSSSHYLLFDL
jgi:hypothetical protein